MKIEWHGQSAFTLRGSERAVLIDPFDQRLRPEGMSIRFDYPQIPQQQVDLLLITHEHFDHNGAAVADAPAEIARALDPRGVLPMHYRTDLIDFLELADAFLAAFDGAHTPGAGEFHLAGVPAGDRPRVVQPGLAAVPA